MKTFLFGVMMLLSFYSFSQKNDSIKLLELPVYTVKSDGKTTFPIFHPNATNAVMTADDWKYINQKKQNIYLPYYSPESIITVPESQMSVVYSNEHLYDLQQLTTAIDLLVKEVNRLTKEVEKLKQDKK